MSIPGFGIFEQRTRSARKGRNPKTGEALDIPEKKVPAFAAGERAEVEGCSASALLCTILTGPFTHSSRTLCRQGIQGGCGQWALSPQSP